MAHPSSASVDFDTEEIAPPRPLSEYSNIVCVGVDFSHYSKYAVEYTLANLLGPHPESTLVVLLHAFTFLTAPYGMFQSKYVCHE